ncbi:LysR family transcriptional regulator [Luteimonas sp. Y-2-2-4F]|nr:LysR substrate-binding domain-containing protein [Luteimonas sp. Y-2-2-4F]MCD9033176.1 LysR family transcriptional regulator [Luteimonas sp. Y-2-2-4F]
MQPAKATELDIDLLAHLGRWRAFVAIGELGSVTRAALFLDSNQSLLSRQLNALERDCGGRLFDRTGRGVQLSELGERIFPRIKALLAEASQLEQDIRSEGREPAGRVTVGMLPSISQALTLRLYAEVSQRWPAVSLKILEGSGGQVEEWLADARVDIAILYRYGASVPEQEQALATVDSYLVGGRGDALTAPGTVRFADLDRLPLILPSAPNGLRTALDAIARQRHIALAPAIEADSLPLQKALPGREAVYTVLPIHAVWDEVAAGTLQAARIVDPALQRSIVMATARAKGPSRAVKAIAAQIDATFHDLARAGMWHRGRGAPA